MTDYSLSAAAENDLRKIYRYSRENFGEAKASAYLQSIEECLLMLVANPEVARDAGHIRKGYFQFSHDHHVIYFKKEDNGLFIVRVLHGAMSAGRHL